MSSGAPQCPICSTPYDASSDPTAARALAPDPHQQRRADDPAVTAPGEPVAAASGVSTPALTPRPDPYSQISNPLHQGWGQTTTTTTAAPPPPATPPPRPSRRRAAGARRARRALLVLLVLALAAGGLWWQRDRVRDGLDEVRDRIDQETEPSTSAPPVPTPAAPAPPAPSPGG